MKLKKICLLLTCVLGIGILSGCTADELTATKNIQTVLNADYTNISGTFSKDGETIAKYNGKTHMQNKENPYFRFIIDNRINGRTEDIILSGQSMYTSNWFFENVILKTYDPDIHEVRELKKVLEQEDFDDDTIIEFDTGIYDYLYYINTVSEDVGVGMREYLATKPQSLRKKTYVEKTRNGYKVIMTGKDFLDWAEEMKETIEGNKTGIRQHLFLSGANSVEQEDPLAASLFERTDNIDYVLNTYETLKPILTNTINYLGKDNTIVLEILHQNNTHHVIITIKGRDEYCLNMIINLTQGTGREELEPGTQTEKVSDLMRKKVYEKPVVQPETPETPKQETVSALSIIWDRYDIYAPFNTGTLLINPGTKTTKTESVDFTIKNDYTYLPLRLLLEKFGETVSWNDKEKQAYVIRDKEEIPVTGELIDSRTFVKIRDFEKLGYTFMYEESDNVKTVKMKKK